MPSEANRQTRKYPAHMPVVEAHNRPVIVMVTVCTQDRAEILATDIVRETLVTAWKEADDWLVGRYVIMPDHVDLFCAPGKWCRHGVKDWVAFWKRLAGQAHAPLHGKFQRDCWDTQMRSVGHYCRKLEYVEMNPVRKGLVAKPEDWPYQGRVTPLSWVT